MSAQESCSAELHRLWKTNATEVPHQRPRGPVAELLEDETLYSYLTRIFMLSGKVSERDFIRDCFGFRVKNLTTNGANRHVLKFLDRLPVGHPLRDDPEARYLLTTTRYDAFFAPQEDRSTRLSSSSEGMPEHASIASRGRWSPLMKPCIPSACLDCMRDDRLSDGVAWWHRMHQLPGVIVCAIHGTPLVSGCANCGPWIRTVNHLALPTSRCECGAFKPLLCASASLCSEPFALAFAREAKYMLHSNHSVDSSLARQLLRQEAAVRYPGPHGICYEKLTEALRRSIGKGFVIDGHARSKSDPVNLIPLIVRTRGSGLAVERYMALTLHLFGCIACLVNATKDRNQRALLEELPREKAKPHPIRLELSSKQLLILLIKHKGVIRRVAEETRLTPYRVQKLVEAHDLESGVAHRSNRALDEKLKRARALYVKGTSLSSIKRQLSICDVSLAGMRRREPSLDAMHRQAQHLKKRESYRTEFLRILERQTKGRTETICLAPSAARWLSANDALWYQQHLPALRPPSHVQGTMIDWARRDDAWSAHIARARDELIFGQKVRLVRIRTNTIIVHLKLPQTIYAAKERLPKTWAALSCFAESILAYRLRVFARVLGGIERSRVWSSKRWLCAASGVPHRHFERFLWLAGFPLPAYELSSTFLRPISPKAPLKAPMARQTNSTANSPRIHQTRQ